MQNLTVYFVCFLRLKSFKVSRVPVSEETGAGPLQRTASLRSRVPGSRWLGCGHRPPRCTAVH